MLLMSESTLNDSLSLSFVALQEKSITLTTLQMQVSGNVQWEMAVESRIRLLFLPS